MFKSSARGLINFPSVIAWAFHGLAGRMANVLIVVPIGKTFAITRGLLVTQLMAATPSLPLLTRDFAFHFQMDMTMWRPRRFFAPECSDIVLCAKLEIHSSSVFTVSVRPLI